MARRGAAAVAVCDLDAERGGETVGLLEVTGGRAFFLRCDVTDEAEVQAAMHAAAAQMNGIDVLVNNAGIVDTQLTDQLRLDKVPTAVWDQIFAVNVRGAWLCIKHSVEYLTRSTAPAIVNCASVSSFVAFPGEAAYCASKAAVVLLTKSAALDFRPLGIRCNCYCPGTVQTPLIETAIASASDPQAERRALEGMHLTAEPRLAQPAEIARAVCFLASEDASFVNGTELRVDAGLLAWRGIAVRSSVPDQAASRLIMTCLISVYSSSE